MTLRTYYTQRALNFNTNTTPSMTMFFARSWQTRARGGMKLPFLFALLSANEAELKKREVKTIFYLIG
jgi:hypothetical protein